MLGPTDKITTEKLGELFIPSATSQLIGGSAPQPLNPIWWATQDAAINLANRYKGLVMLAPPYYPQFYRGIAFSPSMMWHIQIGVALINAGELAQTFTHYPEDRSPGTADRYNNILIEMYISGN